MNEDCASPTDCAEALENLERYLDGELPGDAFDGVKQHLVACYPCADRASFEEFVRSIVRRGCADTAPSDLVARIRFKLDELESVGNVE